MAIGSDKAHINRIESGRQRPTFDTLERLSSALDLPGPDRCQLLGLAGYLLTLPLPHAAEVAEVAKRVSGILHDTPHPTHLVDQEGRIWDVNELFAYTFLGFPDRTSCLSEIRGQRILEMLAGGHRVGRFLQDTLCDYTEFARRHLCTLKRLLENRHGSTELQQVLDSVLTDRQLCAEWLALNAHIPPTDDPHYLDHQVLHVEHPEIGPYTAEVWQSTLTIDPRFSIVHHLPGHTAEGRYFVDLTARQRCERSEKGLRTLKPKPKSLAKTFPNRSIELTVPWAAGGATDVGARIIAPIVSEELGASVTVVNRDVAQSRSYLAKEAARPKDGYHLSFINQPALDAICMRDGRIIEDNPFVLIVNQAFDPIGVFVREYSRYGSLRELIRDAVRRPREVTVSTSGPYTPAHLAGRLLAGMAGVEFRFVHFRDSMEQIARFLSGQADVAFSGSGITVPALHAGDLRGLAMFTRERFPLAPEVATAAENGFDELVVASMRGVWAPKGIPATVLGVLERAFEAALENPLHTKSMHAAGFGVCTAGSAEYTGFIETQRRLLATWDLP